MKRLSMAGCWLLCLALFAGCAGGGELKVNANFTIEDCGTPMQALRLYASTLYKHPDSGKLHLFLEYGNNNGYGIGEEEWEDLRHRFIDVEIETGAMRREVGGRPGGISAHHFLHPNGKMYISEVKSNPAGIAEYDTRTGKYKGIGATGNNSYDKWRLGAGGKIYMGEVGSGVSVYDPKADTLLRYRQPAGRPAFYGVYSFEVDEPFIYCGMTDHGKWWLTVIDTRTSEYASFFDTEMGQPPAYGNGGANVRRTAAGNVFCGSYLLKDGKPLMDAKGHPLPLAKPDESPNLGGGRPWANMWPVTGYGNAAFSYAEKDLGIAFDMADSEPNSWNDGVAAIRWRRKNDADWRTIEIKGLELVPAASKCIGIGPDGMLYGEGNMYGSVFRFDPKTGRSEKIGDPPGSSYQILPTKDATYFCGYVSYLAEWRHDQPYAMNKSLGFEEDVNPKRYRTTAKWTKAMVQGPDGRIYVGGVNGRHNTGGGFSVYDPKQRKIANFRDPYFKYLGVQGLTFLSDGKTLAIITRPVLCGRDEGPKRGSVYLFDTTRDKIVKEIVLADLPAAPEAMFVAGDRRVLAVSREKKVDEYNRTSWNVQVAGLDLENGRVVFEKHYPGRPFAGICDYDRTPLVRGPDGCGWLFVDDWLCRLTPDGALEKVRRIPEYRGSMIFQGKTLYIYNSGRIYNNRFANVVRIPDLFAE